MARFGGVFEASPWIAEAAWERRPFGSVGRLHSAGLDQLTPAQYERITGLTAAYRERFGFPFVVCAREHTPDSIIASAARRLEADPDEEEQTALSEIAKIARLRLADLVRA